ncbi:[FeFe] hydrogenase H-cluster radical SAM maturase HydE [Butyricicoccus sp.]|uniref:[FeFe] hydrogenase H-cluster radical SAM maturase HydE n=1 Tax=Butyricicoccus sp. TaxID=2049021 RepID=UPI003F145366
MKESIEQLKQTRDLPDEQLLQLIDHQGEDTALFEAADQVRREHYGTDVFLRGLIEFTNYCKNDCYYCGIRRSNRCAERYRLTPEQILSCCDNGYAMGFRTFVLQGGEDPRNTDEAICSLVDQIKTRYPDCAVTLSIGEKPRSSYQAYFDAGADRYLLRHETATDAHYRRLHPAELSLENRKRCLFDLKDIGFQVGAGFMVGSPGQSTKELLADLRFLQQLQPDMIGIGPFIPHHETPFAQEKPGTLELTLRMLSILRLMFPYVLLPATTALGTISPIGRELGLKAGANVMMPNLTPTDARKNYDLYDNKICMDEDAGKCRGCQENRVKSVGYRIVSDRGDVRR